MLYSPLEQFETLEFVYLIHFINICTSFLLKCMLFSLKVYILKKLGNILVALSSGVFSNTQTNASASSNASCPSTGSNPDDKKWVWIKRILFGIGALGFGYLGYLWWTSGGNSRPGNASVLNFSTATIMAYINVLMQIANNPHSTYLFSLLIQNLRANPAILVCFIELMHINTVIPGLISLLIGLGTNRYYYNDRSILFDQLANDLNQVYLNLNTSYNHNIDDGARQASLSLIRKLIVHLCHAINPILINVFLTYFKSNHPDYIWIARTLN